VEAEAVKFPLVIQFKFASLAPNVKLSLLLGDGPPTSDDWPCPFPFTHSKYALLAQLCLLRAVDLMVEIRWMAVGSFFRLFRGSSAKETFYPI
jgi:hypothetical protein